jgi:hypothetical protein
VLHLSIKMQNCSIALKQMDYEADLNLVATLERIVRRLPTHLQFKWADAVEKYPIWDVARHLTI